MGGLNYDSRVGNALEGILKELKKMNQRTESDRLAAGFEQYQNPKPQPEGDPVPLVFYDGAGGRNVIGSAQYMTDGTMVAEVSDDLLGKTLQPRGGEYAIGMMGSPLSEERARSWCFSCNGEAHKVNGKWYCVGCHRAVSDCPSSCKNN